MPRKNYRKELQNALKEAGIYEPRLESQIALTVRLEKLVKKMHEKLEDVEIIYETIASNGMEKQEVSPLLDKVMKLEDQLQDAYTALGLNYNSRASNIRESVKKENSEDNGMKNLLESFANG